MQKINRGIGCLLVCWLMLVCGMAQAQTIANANFDAQSLVSPGFLTGPPTSWTRNDLGSGGDSVDNATAGIGNPQSGSNFVELQFGGGLQQTVTGFVAGHTYSLVIGTGYRSGYANGTLNVFKDGTSIGSIAPTTTVSTWADKVYNFTATATSHVLLLQCSSTTIGVVCIDNLRLTDTTAGVGNFANPSFESPTLTVNTFGPGTNIGNWTVNTSNGGVGAGATQYNGTVSGLGGSDPTSGHTGSQWGELGLGAGLIQSVSSLTIGSNYNVTIYARYRQTYANGQIALYVDNALQSSQNPGAVGTWSQLSWSFVATATTHTIEFRHTGANTNGYVFLDDANIVSFATAAPSIGNNNIIVTPTLSGATLSLDTISGVPSTFTYQWYKSQTVNFTSGIGNAVSGATSATIAITPPTTGVDYYRAVVVNSAGSTTSYARPIPPFRTQIKLAYIADSTGVVPDANPGDLINSVPGQLINMLQQFGPRYVGMVNGSVSGTSSNEWVIGNSGNSYGNFVAATNAYYGTSWTGVYVLYRMGVNDAQGHRSAGTYQTNTSATVSDIVSRGAKVILYYPTWREPGISTQGSTTYTFDELTTPYLISYQAVIDGLVNGTTILAGSKTNYNVFAIYPQKLDQDKIHPGITGASVEATMEATDIHKLVGDITISTAIRSIKGGPVHK